MTIHEMRSIREEMQTFTWRMAERMARIPVNTSMDTYENNARFNLWARILLSPLGDKNWWFLHSPVLSRMTNQTGPELIPR